MKAILGDSVIFTNIEKTEQTFFFLIFLFFYSMFYFLCYNRNIFGVTSKV